MTFPEYMVTRTNTVVLCILVIIAYMYNSFWLIIKRVKAMRTPLFVVFTGSSSGQILIKTHKRALPNWDLFLKFFFVLFYTCCSFPRLWYKQCTQQSRLAWTQDYNLLGNLNDYADNYKIDTYKHLNIPCHSDYAETPHIYYVNYIHFNVKF
jgi:hypothetical protein